MNRFLLLLSFLLCFNNLSAQDTLVKTEPPKAASVIYTEADINVDSDTIEAKTFQKNFKKKYTDDDFVYEQKIPEKNWWDYFKEWLADIFNGIFTFENPEASLNFVALLLKVLAILIVVFVIYLIVKALIGKEGKWIFSKEAKQKVIHYSDIEKNIHLLDFEKLIKQSIESGEKRITIRYYYLWLLKVMAKNHYIEWDIEKTNSDYLHELKNPVHKEEFTYLSYVYNYIWYGEFEIDERMFEKAVSRFKNAIKTFNNG
ncbi:DUF4129 domain-containing protein [Flavobacterium limi]|uniref:Protein-glutamine gamma-glutamyltransferase-like C-terminal domain-containing protein n=1 Tax=Flavobacterium limi TaxID=2045105 RepID=A0ABQ1URJ2_9FLAO|nr:DUF4129 domain-containing protein [Flavobacterium limi]GGF25473.1 hypothetical protein GCM10011518_38530 [Flavobacterium limi]